VQKSLTSTLVFQLDIHEGSQQLLDTGQLEARRVVNEIFRLDDEGHDWETIEAKVVERSKTLLSDSSIRQQTLSNDTTTKTTTGTLDKTTTNRSHFG
jgi:hypothetical protein